MDHPKIEEAFHLYVKEEEVDSMKELSEKNSDQKKNAYFQEGQWTDEENLKAILFLEYFKDIFSYKNRRRNCHIFTWLSKAMGNKTPRQCRCRHQKMMLRFKNFNGAKKHLINIFGKQVFQLKYIQNIQEFQYIALSIKEIGLQVDIVKKNEYIKNDILISEGIKVEENGDGPVL